MPLLAEAAQAYAGRGIAVFPVWGVTGTRCDCGKDCGRDAGKHPLGVLVRHGVDEASTDPEQIRRWWAAYPNANVALALDGLAVVDVDRHGALLDAQIDLPNTAAQRTGRDGGFHYIFRLNGAAPLQSGPIAPGVDLKTGKGAYIIAAPSRHVSGRVYEWAPGHALEDVELPDLPPPVVEMARAAHRGGNGKAGGVHDFLGRLDFEKTFLEIEAAEPAGNGELWRRRMLQIVLSLIGRGLRDDLIMAVCHRATWRTRGWTHAHTDEFVSVEIARARAKFDRPEPDEDEETFDRVDGARQGETQDRLRLVPPSEMDWRGAQLNLIKGILGFGMMALIYGESGSAKTLIALSLALHVALGRDWCGRKVRQGFVAYIAPEGGHSVHLRCHAWAKHHGVTMSDAIPFRTIPVTVDLCSSAADLTGIIANIKAAEGDLGPCVLAAIDTVSRALAGGDENSSESMGRFVVNCDRLREEIGATVLGVHHTPRGGSTPRGHSSLQNGAEIRLHARKVATGLFALTLEHLKDGEAGEELMFSLHSAVVGKNEDGEEVSGGLVTKAGITAAGAPGNPHGKLTDRQLRVLQEMSKQTAATKRWEFTTEEFNELCVRSGAVDHGKADNARRARCSDLKMQLANRGHISITGDIIRLVISPCV